MRKSYKEMLIEKSILLKNIDRLTFLECMEQKSRLLYSLASAKPLIGGFSAGRSSRGYSSKSDTRIILH
ncbi:hypothetical protein TDB9533_00537 [Thalassocella blandensis]|nr:hypothetical protein TDB9533_00537 [Thalassocella blandensis]